MSLFIYNSKIGDLTYRMLTLLYVKSDNDMQLFLVPVCTRCASLHAMLIRTLRFRTI